MPIPFLIGAAALGATLFGAKKGYDAMTDSKDSKAILTTAKNMYDEALSNLETQKGKTMISMETLGERKLIVWGNQLGRFANVISHIKGVDITGAPIVEGIPLEDIDVQEIAASSTRASEIIAGGTMALGTGALAGLAAVGGVKAIATASTGVAIKTLTGVAATNATLAWLGGGSLAAGGLGVAGGTAILGGIIAAPVFAVGGMLMAAKARQKLAEARTVNAEAEKAVEKINGAASILSGLEKVCELNANVIDDLGAALDAKLDRVEVAIASARERNRKGFWRFVSTFWYSSICKKEIPVKFNHLDKTDQHLIHLTYQIAQATKHLIEKPLLKDNGQVHDDVIDVINPIKAMLV